MTPQVFDAFRRLVYREAGIALRESKSALVTARIARRMRELGLEDAGEYLRYVEADGDGAELVLFLDSITTNFTSFFRESDHFQVLADEVRSALAGGKNSFRVWCAAAATGEEPYTLAMTLNEALLGSGADFRILATDLSQRALRFAEEGRYPESRLAQVPARLRQRYFKQESRASRDEAWFRVAPELRERIVFGRLNLATPPFPLRGELDVVFCRNVMIYFDGEVRRRLVGEIERLTRVGGLFVVAHAETLGRTRGSFRAIHASAYRKAAA